MNNRHTDSLHFGWQGSKFVLLVLSNLGAIKHRISLDTREQTEVRNCMTARAGCEHEPNWLPQAQAHSMPGHVQIDTKRELGDDIIRIADYQPETGLVPPLQDEHRVFGLTRWRNKPAWTNGHVILVGIPPEGDKREVGASSLERALRDDDAQAVRPICVQTIYETVDPDYSHDPTVVWFDSGLPLNALYYDIIVERYPNAQFRRAAEDTVGKSAALSSALLIFEDERAKTSVGAVMPMRFNPDLIVQELREEVRQHLFVLRGGVGTYYTTAACAECGRYFSDDIHFHNRYKVQIDERAASGLQPGEHVDEERIAQVRADALASILAAPERYESPCCLAALDTNGGTRLACQFCRRSVNPVGAIKKKPKAVQPESER